MRVYHERLWVPVSWWLVGLAVIVILGTELAAGFGGPAVAAIYAVLVAGWAALLLSWGRPMVEVAGGELIVGRARLPLAAVGEGHDCFSAQAEGGVEGAGAEQLSGLEGFEGGGA